MHPDEKTPQAVQFLRNAVRSLRCHVDSVAGARSLDTHIAVSDVFCHCSGLAFRDWTIAATPVKPEAQHIATLQGDHCLGREPTSLAIWIQHSLGDSTGPAPEQAVRLALVSVTQESHYRSTGSQFYILA